MFSFTSNSAPEPFLQKSTDLICDSLGEHLQTEAILTLCCSLLELRPQPFHIKKGERAIALCMPVTYRRKSTEGDEETETTTYQRFMIKNNWFVLSQTEGNEYTPEPIPEWNEMTALEALNISKVTFDSIDGNAQGYAAPGRKISISPMAAHPYKTLFTKSVTFSSVTWKRLLSVMARRSSRTSWKSKPNASPWFAAPPSGCQDSNIHAGTFSPGPRGSR